MSLRIKLTAFAAALVLAGAAFANDEICPNLSDMQAEGISATEQIGNNVYVGFSLSNFNSEPWGYAIGPVLADSDDEAIDIANDVLANMSSQGYPIQLDDDYLVCLYDTGNPFIYSIAIRGAGVGPMKLKQYLQKIH
ncbi:MAG: DUF4949 domain-containing protein [Legionella longbeachae]|nr:DUF4949 domain-containing protein [Legionella longbeachae]